MLFGRHLGYKGDFQKQLAAREPKAVELFEAMEEVKEEAATFMKVRAVWQFFEAESEGERLHVFQPRASEPAHTWNFKRQVAGDRLCLSDYILPTRDGKRDHVAVFVVTAGEGVRERSEAAKNAGYYFRSHGGYARNRNAETAQGASNTSYDSFFGGVSAARPLGRNAMFNVSYTAFVERTELSGCTGSCSSSFTTNQISVGVSWHARPFVLRQKAGRRKNAKRRRHKFMYKSFFGLKENPFNVNPDPRYLFLTKQIEEALSGLMYGIQTRKGFITLTGEVGTGKTTLVNRLLDWLHLKRTKTAFLFNSRMNTNQLFDFIMARPTEAV